MGDYVACSVDCGGGNQTRPLDCVQETRRTHGTNVTIEVLEDTALCPPPSPDASRPCNVIDCPTRWIISDWSQVSRHKYTHNTYARRPTYTRALVFTYTRIHVHTRTHTCTPACTHNIIIQTHPQTYHRTLMHVHTLTHMNTRLARTHTRTHARTRTRTRAHISAHTNLAGPKNSAQ